MSEPYLLLSDTHYHAWNQFARVDENGMNSRLKILLEETERAFAVAREQGIRLVFHAGDMFHTRGSLVPSVLNPTGFAYANGAVEGMSIKAIAGNHDLESNDTRWLTAATSALRHVGFTGTDGEEPYLGVVLLNWEPNLQKLKERMERFAARPDARELDLIIHAPVNGVLLGIPNHGLDADYLQGLGFKRVFAGHYHNHKCFDGTDVYSIGALTHQTWSDVGTKAGFCLVYPDRVEWHASHAPQFVDLPEDAFEAEDEEALIESCDGNYVRMLLSDPTKAREEKARAVLEANGAKGILLRSPKAAATMTHKRTETVAGIESIGDAVRNYATNRGGAELASLCDQIMREAV